MTNPALGKVEHGTTIFCPRLDQGFLFETVLELENINNYFNNFKLLLFQKGFDIKDPRIEKFQVKDIYVGYGQSYITEKIYIFSLCCYSLVSTVCFPIYCHVALHLDCGGSCCTANSWKSPSPSFSR